MPPRKKEIPWSFRQLLVKICFMTATIVIGLYCGLTASYTSFYVAVLIQAINNAYESFELLAGYNRFITAFQAVAFLGAGVSAILAVLFFSGAPLGCRQYVLGIAVALSIPVIHFLIEAIVMCASGKN